MAPLLAAGHVVYALDLAGYGYSGANGRYGINDQAALIDTFVRHLHLQKPMLLGHSQGAAFVGAVALAHPEDAGKVVFVDGDGRSIPTPPSWVRKAFVRAPYLTTVYRAATNWTGLAKSMIRRACGPGCGPTDAEANAWLRPLRQHRTERAFFKMAEHGVPALTPAQISAIAVPRAIIWGQLDHPGGSLSDTITALHHPRVHVIPNAGHLSMMADPAGFARAVLSEAPPPRDGAADSAPDRRPSAGFAKTLPRTHRVVGPRSRCWTVDASPAGSTTDARSAPTAPRARVRRVTRTPRWHPRRGAAGGSQPPR